MSFWHFSDTLERNQANIKVDKDSPDIVSDM